MLSGRRKLLLADDSPTIQKVISLTFEDEGLEVVAVSDGERALDALYADEPPDIVLADVHMPGPNGYELCERVRGDARLRHVPFVLLVGTFEPFNQAEARRVGADTVLTKPFQSIRDLVSKVGSLLGGGEARHDEETAREQTRGDEAEHATLPADAHAPREAFEPVAQSRDEHAEDTRDDQATHFADFAADDELIEARPADAFGGATAYAEPPSREQFVAETHAHEAATHEHEAEAREHEALAHEAAAEQEYGDDRTREHEVFAEQHFESREHEPVGTNGHAPAEREAQHPSSEAQPLSFEAQPPSHEAGPSSTFEAQTPSTSFEAWPSSSFAASSSEAGESVFAAHASYVSRAASAAAADDALLDLGQMESHAADSATEADDFILDLGDDFPSHDTPAGHDAVASQSHSYDEHQQSAFAQFEFSAPHASTQEHDAHVEAEVVMQDEPQDFMQNEPQNFATHAETHEAVGARVGFVEPEVVPADEPVPASVESEFTDGSVEGDVPKPPVGSYVAHVSGYDTNPTFEAATHEPAHEMAAPQAGAQESVSEPSTIGYVVGDSRVGLEEPLNADQLSPEAVEKIARRVVELMSDKVVREIAWEVVPELAELLIKQKLEEEKK